MKLFVTGGTGAIGRVLLPKLVDNNYEVFALVRNPNRSKMIESLGVKTIIAEVLNKDDLKKVIKKIEPEVIIHQLTALKNSTGNFKKFDEEFALTNRFRTEVTDTLIEAARLVGTKRFIAQSFGGWPNERKGGSIKTEKDPLDSSPPANFRKTLAAIQYLENAIRNVKDFDALALRYGIFYGSGTGFAKDGIIAELIKKHKMPIVGDGKGVWSFTHIDDAASSTIKAIKNGNQGIYNVVDDEPAMVKDWLPFLTNVLGAKPPSKVPEWVAKFIIGEGGISMMTQIRGCSNTKAKLELSWQPLFSSWRQGFEEEFG